MLFLLGINKSPHRNERQVWLTSNTGLYQNTYSSDSVLDQDPYHIVSEELNLNALSLSPESSPKEDRFKSGLSTRSLYQEDTGSEEMDWVPTAQVRPWRSKVDKGSENICLGPQHFFPPETLTGLELQLMKTDLSDKDDFILSPTSTTAGSRSDVQPKRWRIFIHFISFSYTAAQFMWLRFKEILCITENSVN